MYSVSDLYKKDMMGNLRGESSIEIAHSIPNLHNDTATFPDGLFGNEVNYYFNDQVQAATFEPSGCVLDGTYYLRGDGVNQLGEYVSAVATTSVKTVSVDYLITLATAVTAENIPEDIYLKFDSKELVKVTGLTISMMDGASVLASDTYDTTDFDGYKAQLTLPTVAPESVTNLDSIKITITSIDLPYAYVRLEKVILGIVNEFTDEDITGATWTVASDPLTFQVPSADFSFTFIDPFKIYHESNPNGKFDNIVENQLVGFRFGYTPDGSGTEWVNGGVYRTTGEKSITEGVIPQVNISTKHISVGADDLVRELDSTLVSSDDETEVSISLDDASHSLNTLIESLGITMNIDAVETTPGVYDNIIDTATMVDSNITVKQYAQLAANAFGMIWLIDRTSTTEESITLREFPNLIMDSSDNYDSALLDIYNQSPTFHNLFSGVYLFQFNNENLLELPRIGSVPVSDGIDYARYNHTTNDTERGLYPVGATGTRLIKIDNPFVTVNFAGSNTEPNKLFGRYVWDYYQEHKTYTLINRGFPELDVGDIVHLYVHYYEDDGETIAYTLDKRCIVMSNKISYDGAIRGETKVLEWDIVLGEDYGA